MKTATDPRHKKRQRIVKDLFAHSFIDQKISNEKAQEIIGIHGKIDKMIEKIAPEFPIDKLNKIDLAILRLAIYELKFEKKEPTKVIVDEAIELAKEFGGDRSPSFINGALGNLLKKNNG